MKISAKTRYGVKAMLELAKNYGSYPLTAKTISERQKISFPYLEQILNKLHKAKLVRSVRGTGGGFLLAKKPKNIKIIDIISALGESVTPVECVDELKDNQCKRIKNCVTYLLWKKLNKKIKEVLEGTTLKDLCEWKTPLSSTFDQEHLSYI